LLYICSRKRIYLDMARKLNFITFMRWCSENITSRAMSESENHRHQRISFRTTQG